MNMINFLINNFLKTMESFITFIKKFPICFIVPSMKLKSYRYGEYIHKFLPDSHLSIDVPETNNKEILIIVPTKSSSFEELHHLNFLEKNYEKFPRSIIVIIGFDNLISMINPFDFMGILHQYRIPLLYSSINDERIVIDIKLTDFNDYQDSVNYTKDNGNMTLHVIHHEEFIDNLKSMNFEKSSNIYSIYCYYSNEADKQKWIEIIDRYIKVYEFFYKLMSSDALELKIENNMLMVI